MKKSTSIILALVLCISLCACSSIGNSTSREISVGTAEINGCTVQIASCENKLYRGTLSVAYAYVTINFTNNSDSATSLTNVADIKAYQDGVELDTTSVWALSDLSPHSARDNVLPGSSATICLTFDLNFNTTSPVLIQISDGAKVVTEKSFNLS